MGMGKISVAGIIVALLVVALYVVSVLNPLLFGVQMSLVTLIAFLLVIGLIIWIDYER
jgi:hypothetical protein